MRTASSQIWDTWQQGGPFIGDDAAPHSRVTVDIDWWLNVSSGPVGNWSKLPIRWWQKCDDSQTETEVPNIKSISIDRSLDSDAAECSIVLYNQWMDPNDQWREGETLKDLGTPGYFTWNHGASAEARSRWGHEVNAWANVLTPNALLRTYQGYGGRDKTIADARADGNIIRSGVWLVDDVRVSTNGLIELKCRDMAKLLIEQIVYPPLVPDGLYPLSYARWKWKDVAYQHVNLISQAGEKRRQFSLSANNAWFNNGSVIENGSVGNGILHRHNPADAYNGNDQDFWLSVGNGHSTDPWAWEWIEADCGDYVDTVYIHPIGGPYRVFISIFENGAWQGGPGVQPIWYNPGNVGRYYQAQFEARIPYVHEQGIPPNTPIEIKLPRAYKADKVRCTFTNLVLISEQYRCAIREIRHLLKSDITQVETRFRLERFDGNFYDFTDIIKDLLLWSGWWCQEDVPANEAPHVYGNLESTGIPGVPGVAIYEGNDYEITSEPFDKRPVIDAITRIKELVGYNFWVDDEGGVRFEPPNWWMPGNNFYEDGSRTTFVPEIDEKLVLTDYSVMYGDQNTRSEIIITSYDPATDHPVDSTTATTRFKPRVDDNVLRGMVRPAMYQTDFTITQTDQRAMAEILGFQLWFQQRPGAVTCVANPAIQINDQVRIYERQTGETYIHYVRGVRSEHDLDAGTYTMSLTTNWLGDNDNWVIDVNNGEIGPTPVTASNPLAYVPGPFSQALTPNFNNRVLLIQAQLRSHGYSLDVDGYFGPITTSRVISFQVAHGLTVDGIVGPATWAALWS